MRGEYGALADHSEKKVCQRFYFHLFQLTIDRKAEMGAYLKTNYRTEKVQSDFCRKRGERNEEEEKSGL